MKRITAYYNQIFRFKSTNFPSEFDQRRLIVISLHSFIYSNLVIKALSQIMHFDYLRLYYNMFSVQHLIQKSRNQIGIFLLSKQAKQN